MFDMIKAMQDPEFLAGLQAMPQQIVDKLNTIDAKLDILLTLTGVDVEAVLQQSSNAVNPQNGVFTETQKEALDRYEGPSINPIDPDSYK